MIHIDLVRHALRQTGHDTLSSLKKLNINQNVIREVHPIISEMIQLIPESAEDLRIILNHTNDNLIDLGAMYNRLHEYNHYADLKKVRKAFSKNLARNFGVKYKEGRGLEDEPNVPRYIDDGKGRIYIQYPFSTQGPQNKPVSSYSIRLFRSALARLNHYLTTYSAQETGLLQKKALIYSFLKPLSRIRAERKNMLPSIDDFYNTIKLMARDERLEKDDRVFLLLYCVVHACEKVLGQYPEFANIVKTIELPPF